MSDLVSRLTSSLADRYRLERELGGGGMSRVWVATETALDRQVVVKVIAAELTEGLSAERFAREIRLAARLQQANIVPVLNAGTAAGLPYYTMPYVRGESLRAKMASGAPLTLMYTTLERAIDARDSDAIWILNSLPSLRPLRRGPRYQALLGRMGLPEHLRR